MRLETFERDLRIASLALFARVESAMVDHRRISRQGQVDALYHLDKAEAELAKMQAALAELREVIAR